MDASISIPKLIVPGRRSDLISRQRLLDLVGDLLDTRLFLVIAPAGYGKTSLLIDLAGHTEMPICWYSLDSLDQDLRRFLTHFAASLAKRFPQFEAVSTAVSQRASSAEPDPEQMARFLANEVYENIREHFAIVLDDFQAVNESQEINSFVNRFIQAATENCHVAILSRSLINLPDLPHLVGRSQVAGLGFRDLIFQPDEIQALILQNYHISIQKSQADKLFQETEGWITGLLMSTQAIYQGMVDQLRLANVSGVGLYDYLAQQVLDQQPAPVREFLLQTAFFDEFDAGLCSEVLGPPPASESWQGLIKTVLQENLFVQQMGEKNLWLRYHHLFQSFLQNRLLQERPEEANRIMKRMAEVSIQRGDWERAYAIYQRLGSDTGIADLLERVGSLMVRGGYIGTLARWLDLLPPGMLAARPVLLAQSGVTAAALGEPTRGETLLNRAITALRKQDHPLELVRALTWRAFAFYIRADYDRSLLDTDEAISLSQENSEPDFLRAEALRLRGMNFRLMGNLSEAIRTLNESLEYFQRLDDFKNGATVSGTLGAAFLDSGSFEQALAYYQPLLEYYRKVNNLFALPSTLNDLGCLHCLRGDYERANALLEESVERARQTGNAHLEALALTGLGDLFRDLGALETAANAYEQARQVAATASDYFTLFYLDVFQAALARMRGDPITAKGRLASAEEYSRRSSSDYVHGLFFAETGRLEAALGNPPGASEALKKAAEIFEKGGQRIEAVRANLFFAAALYQSGCLQEATAAMEHVFYMAASLENKHGLILAGREVKTLLEEAAQNEKLRGQSTWLLVEGEYLEKQIPAARQRLRRQDSVVPQAPPRLHIQVLGTIKVAVNGKQVSSSDWQTQVTRDLFFLLLNSPEGLTKEAIGEILWPGSAPEQLKLRFKNTMYRLRRALQMEAILYEQDTYWFNHSLDYEYDVETFWDKIDCAHHDPNPEKQWKAYQKAARLYKGAYLAEMTSAWVLPERQRIWQAWAEACLKLADYHLQAKEYEQTIDYGMKLLTEDDCMEEAYRLVMLAYAALGNRAEVARQYDRCQQALKKEVGLPPSSLTTDLYKSLIA